MTVRWSSSHWLFDSCRILNKFLDSYQEDMLPWHESIEPCLSSMTAFIGDREVGSDWGGALGPPPGDC